MIDNNTGVRVSVMWCCQTMQWPVDWETGPNLQQHESLTLCQNQPSSIMIRNSTCILVTPLQSHQTGILITAPLPAPSVCQTVRLLLTFWAFPDRNGKLWREKLKVWCTLERSVLVSVLEAGGSLCPPLYIPASSHTNGQSLSDLTTTHLTCRWSVNGLKVGGLSHVTCHMSQCHVAKQSEMGIEYKQIPLPISQSNFSYFL